MGPFRRTRSSLDAAGVVIGGRPIDFRVESHEYRRLGHALATVVVGVQPAPRAAETRLRITAGGDGEDLAPMLTTCEAPGTDEESHRLWFVTDLSRVMFGDATFALLVGGKNEIALPEPTPRAAWDEDEPAVSSAWSRSELEAAVRALEARCRSAERVAAADEPDDTAAQREVATLQELLALRESAYRAVKDVVDATAADRDARQAELESLQEDGRRTSKLVAATLAEVQTEREALLKQLQDSERDRQELRAQMAAQADELALAKAALKQQQDRFGAPDAGAGAPRR